MNEINSFTFYKDYYCLIATLPKKDKLIILEAIVDYVFKDIETDLYGHNLAIFNTLKHQIDKSKNKSKNAKKNNSSENQNEIKSKSNENQNEIKKGNKTSVFSFKFYISNFKFINNNTKLINKLEEWFKYKSERKENYRETGLKTLLNRIDNYVQLYGTDVIIELIDESMSNNWKGIIFEKLKNNKQAMDKPEWIDKDIQPELATDDEQKRIEEMLEEFK